MLRTAALATIVSSGTTGTTGTTFSMAESIRTNAREQAVLTRHLSVRRKISLRPLGRGCSAEATHSSTYATAHPTSAEIAPPPLPRAIPSKAAHSCWSACESCPTAINLTSAVSRVSSAAAAPPSLPRGRSRPVSEAARNGRSASRWSPLALSFSLLSIGACGTPEPLSEPPRGPWHTFEGDYLTYRTRPGDPLACESYRREVEDWALTLLDFFELKEAERPHTTWYQFGSADFVNGASPCDSGEETGCTVGHEGYGLPETLEHEFVHMYANAVGHPPPLFTEGLAVSLSCTPDPGALANAPAGDWRFYLHQRAVSYWAPRFVTYLLDRHGTASFLELYGALRFDATEGEVVRGFETVYGQSIDSAWADMLADRAGRRCVGLLACRAPAATSGPSRLGRACDAARGRTLPTSTAAIALHGSGVVPLWCQEEADLNHLLLEGEEPIWLGPGGRKLALLHDGESPASTVSVSLDQGVLTERCDEAVPIAVDGPGYEQRALIAPTGTPLYVAFDAANGAKVVASEYSGQTNHQLTWRVETCAQCAGGVASDCDPSFPTLDGRFWIKATHTQPPSAEFFALQLRSE